MDQNDAAFGRHRVATPRDPIDADETFASLNLLGDSPAFRNMLHLIRRLAPSEATVLIHGETGTGKELAARAIHYLSPRRDGPFIPVNCGAIPDALVESELFGHARGAFTDACVAREGSIAEARGGTLFLDELEVLSPRGQVALLRFLQDQQYRPVGGVLVRAANVRVVGSTNVDLAALARHGGYRRDLVYRLNVLAMELPPLRARGDDVLILARAFLDRLYRQYGSAQKRLHPETLVALRLHSWPGNVRELENLIHREFLLCDQEELRFSLDAPRGDAAMQPRDGEEGPLTRRSFREAKARAISEFERTYIAELLERAGGNISLAARLAGKERSRLGKLIRKYGFSAAVYRIAAADAGSP